MLNYASAFVALFTPLVGLGLKDIVIREVVRDPTTKDELLGTALTLQFLAGLLAMGLSIGSAHVSLVDDILARFLVVILSGRLILLAFSNTLGTWFESRIQAKYSVWSRNLALIIFALVRVKLVFSKAPLVAFAWAILINDLLIVLGMVIWYHASKEQMVAWQVSFSRAKQLLRDSWPLIVSGLAVIIYMKVDQIMLGNMATEEEVGLYSAAVRLSELWYFIPMALASSLFPTIIRSREDQSEQTHHERMQLFFDLMAGVAYAVVIPTALLAPWVVTTLFGSDYTESGLILRVHIWAFVFVSLGVARSKWLMAENMTRFSMTATILGAIVNVGLNFWLIPQYAGLGAAWATLISYAVSAYLSTLLSVRLWPLFGQISRSALVPFRLFSLWNSLRRLSLGSKI